MALMFDRMTSQQSCTKFKVLGMNNVTIAANCSLTQLATAALHLIMLFMPNILYSFLVVDAAL